jgi:FlaA1/EpsC-like NDP-sugar epimerase
MEAAFNNFHPSTNLMQPFKEAHPQLAFALMVVLILLMNVTPIVVAFVLRPKTATTLFSSVVATVIVVGMYYLLENNSTDFTSIILPAFISCLVIWTFTFHWVAYHVGWCIRQRYGDSPWVKQWVKEIDYIYLLVSSLSLLKLVITQIHPHDELKVYNALAAVALGTALALRITKTSIEVWGWDEPKRRGLLVSRGLWKRLKARSVAHA